MIPYIKIINILQHYVTLSIDLPPISAETVNRGVKF